LVGKGKTSFMGANGLLVQLPTPPQPGIIIGVVSTNQVMVTITNGASYANYELYHRTLIDPAYPWTLWIVGAPAQTNFTVEMNTSLAFWEVGVGSDWDGDGVPNYCDGDPLDPTVGILTVTIDSPAQGAIITQ